MHAIYKNDKKIVKLLLSNANVDINLQNLKGKTALMIAVEEKHIELVKLLLDSEANVNLKDNDGKTALMLAIEKNYAEIIELLKQ